MNEQVQIIRLVEVVGDGLCSSSEDGDKVHAAIKLAIERGAKVTLSFKDVEDLTSAFLNSAIGRLYGEFSEEILKNSLLPTDATQDQLFAVKRAVERAKSFFADPGKHKAAMKSILGVDDEERE